MNEAEVNNRIERILKGRPTAEGVTKPNWKIEDGTEVLDPRPVGPGQVDASVPHFEEPAQPDRRGTIGDRITMPSASLEPSDDNSVKLGDGEDSVTLWHYEDSGFFAASRQKVFAVKPDGSYVKDAKEVLWLAFTKLRAMAEEEKKPVGKK